MNEKKPAARSRRKEQVRREILDAAGILFDKEGYTHVTVRRIAESAGYSQGVVFYYFKDKADMLASLCKLTFDGLSTRFSDIRATNTDCVQMLDLCSRAYITFGREHPHHYRIALAPPSELGHLESVRFIGEIGRDTFRQINALIQQCIVEGRFRQVDVNIASHSWWSCIHGLTLFLITHSRTPWVHPEPTVNHTLQTLFAGLAAEVNMTHQTIADQNQTPGRP